MPLTDSLRTVLHRSYTSPLSDFPDFTSSYLSFGIYSNWSSNSPLPPNFRYMELNDLRFFNRVVDLAAWSGESDLTILLPHNQDGQVMRNIKPTPEPLWPDSGTYFSNPDPHVSRAALIYLYNDDTYWTGTVRDPVAWKDKFWDNQGIDRATIATYLEAHPRSKLY